MSSFDTQTTQGNAESTQQPGKQQAQAPVPPGKSPAMTNVPGLPPTALSMQMTSLNNEYQAAQMGAMGSQIGTGGPLMMQPGQQQGSMQRAPGAPPPERYAQSSLKDLAEKLATGYGLNFSRGSLVDQQGQFMQTPDQLATLQQGGDAGNIAAQMNRIAQAVNDQRIQGQQNKGIAALAAGAGLMQQRGTGSLAELQSNFYQAMAAVYTDPNLLPEQQDFSFWIQQDAMDEAASTRQKEDRETGGGKNPGGGGGSGAPIVSQPTIDNRKSTDTGPQGKGDVVTTGPHAGQRPIYTYDPRSKTTTVSWENA